MKQIIAVLVGVILASGVLVRGQAPELQRIPFSAIQGVRVGNAQDDAAGTGVTVFRLTVPGCAAVAVFGGGPASRETEAIAPERNHPLNALVFSGGSAYGLAASGGVARCLEEHGVGFDTGIARVPIVCQSCIYDLGYGSATVRPDEQMGYSACEASFAGNDTRSGNVGAGTGATVGKAAGMLSPDRSAFADSYTTLLHTTGDNLFTSTTNTTLVAVFTNGDFTPTQLKHLAQMASAGLARSINPVFTTADGDTIYAVSVGDEACKVTANLDAAGALSASLVEEAIADAVYAAKNGS